MQCKKVNAAGEQLADPAGGAWGSITAEALELAGTPLANQPSGYIKASRNEREIGKIRNLSVQTAHDGAEIYFRLSWGDENQDLTVTDTNQFPDGCGILMPVGAGDSPIEEMGSRDAPVNAWFWRADFEPDTAFSQVAHGLGTTIKSAAASVKARGVWQQGTWTVVFHRPLALPSEKADAVQLAAGAAVKVGFAIWEGHSGERAGVKSFSKEWRELALEA